MANNTRPDNEAKRELRTLTRGPVTGIEADPSSPSNGRSPAAGPPAPDLAERLAYSISEAARLTGLSRDLLYDQMRCGHLAYVKIGRRRLITRDQLQQFLADSSS